MNISYVKSSKDNQNHKIVHGFPCNPREYPYLVSLKTVSRQIYCGGSLLNRFNILTAAHCCDPNKYKGQIIVYAGVKEKFEKLKVVKHFEQKVRAWKRYFRTDLDICVIRLIGALEVSPYIKFAKLATRRIFDELMLKGKCNKSLSLGFGFQGILPPPYDPDKDKDEDEKGEKKKVVKFDPTLHCVHLKVLPLHNLHCCPYNYVGFCAIGADHHDGDTCVGDSGGPLICDGIQIGFVQSGFGCGAGGCYARTFDHYDLIMGYLSGVQFKINIILCISCLLCHIIIRK